LGREQLLFREKEKETLGWDKSGGDKNGRHRLAIKIGQLIRHKAEHIISFEWKFNKDSLPEGAFSRGGEGIGQLFGRGIDILNDRDRREETISPVNQFAAQDIGRDHPNQVEQEEEADQAHARELEDAMEEGDIDVGDQRVEDTVEGVEDELQNEKGDPEGQDD
jgi:hypothetical protein